MGAAAGEAAGVAAAGALLAIVPIGEILGPALAPVLGSLGALVGGAVAGAVVGFAMDEAKEVWDKYGDGAVKEIGDLCDDVHQEAHKVADWTEHVAEATWHKGSEELKHIDKVLLDKEKKVVNYIANTAKGVAEDADKVLNILGCDNALGKNKCNANPLCYWCNNKSECWEKLNPVHTAQQCECFNDLTHDDNETQCQDKTKCYWCNNTSKCRSAITDLDGMCDCFNGSGSTYESRCNAKLPCTYCGTSCNAIASTGGLKCSGGKMVDTLEDTGKAVKDCATHPEDCVGDMANSTVDAAKDTGKAIGHAADATVDAAKDTGKAIGHGVSSVTSSVGNTLESGWNTAKSF